MLRAEAMHALPRLLAEQLELAEARHVPEPVKMAFERQVVVLPLSNILPIKRVPDTIKQAMRYKRIVAPIAEVGIVEPLWSSPAGRTPDPIGWSTATYATPHHHRGAGCITDR